MICLNKMEKNMRLCLILLLLLPSYAFGARRSCNALHGNNYTPLFEIKQKVAHINSYDCPKPITFSCVKKNTHLSRVDQAMHVVYPALRGVIGQFATIGYSKSVSVGPGGSSEQRIGTLINIGVDGDAFLPGNGSLIDLDLDTSWSKLNIWNCQYRRWCEKTFRNDSSQKRKCHRQFYRLPAQRRVVRKHDGPIALPFFRLVAVRTR